jgi:hypothetical protein
LLNKKKISYQNYSAVNQSLLDTLKCNLEETNNIFFENSLRQRIAKNFGSPPLFNSSKETCITYLTYDEPWANYLLITVITDSLYHFSTYQVKQNFCDDNKFKQISEKYLSTLSEIDYSIFISDTTFNLDYCYVTDRVDKIIFSRTNGVLVNGVNTYYFEGMNLPRQKYGPFDKLGDALYQKLRFR